MNDLDQLRSLLATLSEDRRLAAQQRVSSCDMAKYGDDAKKVMRTYLARILAERLMHIGKIETVFSRPRRDAVVWMGDSIYEQWEVEMIVMTQAEFSALNSLCSALLREVESARGR